MTLNKNLANRSSRLCTDLIHYFDGEGQDLAASERNVLREELTDLHRILSHYLSGKELPA